MKNYKALFTFFLYESILVFVFGQALNLINDPITKILIPVSLISFFIAIILGITGYAFGLFKERNLNENF